MNARTLGWFVFLSLIKNMHFDKFGLQLQDSHLTALEGSCVEIKCKITDRNLITKDAYWFWMKDAYWDGKDFNATIVYSTDTSKRPISPDFTHRVEYTGNSGSYFSQCGISLCDLKKTDSGNYSVRYVYNLKWKTQTETNLTVTDNPCLITFEEPAAVKESDLITLKCSTLSSCPSDPEIDNSNTQIQNLFSKHNKQKMATFSFKASWEDDGKEFSCQTQDNTDIHLIRKIKLTVEYAPKDMATTGSPVVIKEGQHMTLTCSAKGQPPPTFTWFNDKDEQMHSEAIWEIPSINYLQGGQYYCKAENKLGKNESNVFINVIYVPQVEVITTSAASVFKEGDNMTLTCNLMRSNPAPTEYIWTKSEQLIGENAKLYFVERVKPEDSGPYRCKARNTVGTGESNPLEIKVQYRPRRTSISTSQNDVKVKLGYSITFYCNTDAYPDPTRHDWIVYNKNDQTDSSQWRTYTHAAKELKLYHVQRTDEACYICNATNSIGTGERSGPVCIEVLYGPTNFNLSMTDEDREGHLFTITCTVESSPVSQLQFRKDSISTLQYPEELFSQYNHYQYPNSLEYTFNLTSDHTGVYTCFAKNQQGSNTSKGRKLTVKYAPKYVTVKAQPNLTVKENASLTLRCDATSHPQATSFTWTKMIDGKSEIIQTSHSITVESVSISNGGVYRCKASNEMGTGYSEETEVKVKYGPKHTTISRAPEQQHPDGRSSVTLSCSSQSYPPVTEYSWYKKEKEWVKKLSKMQTYTVDSDQPGEYYCAAKNEISQRTSDPVKLFVDRAFKRAMKFLFSFLLILFVVLFIIFVCRRKRKKTNQQGTANGQCCGLLSLWTCTRRGILVNEPATGEPFRSRDDLLQEQPRHANGQRQQPCPDSTSAFNTTCVYSSVVIPLSVQGISAQEPVRQQGGHTNDESLNYTSIYFGNKQKIKEAKAEENPVYAAVSKKPSKKGEQERLEDYENVDGAHMAKLPDPLNFDSETSEDEVDLNYSQVSFKAKPGHRRGGKKPSSKPSSNTSSDTSSETSSDSSTSDEEEKTQYSQVKV